MVEYVGLRGPSGTIYPLHASGLVESLWLRSSIMALNNVSVTRSTRCAQRSCICMFIDCMTCGVPVVEYVRCSKRMTAAKARREVSIGISLAGNDWAFLYCHAPIYSMELALPSLLHHLGEKHSLLRWPTVSHSIVRSNT